MPLFANYILKVVASYRRGKNVFLPDSRVELHSGAEVVIRLYSR